MFKVPLHHHSAYADFSKRNLVAFFLYLPLSLLLNAGLLLFRYSSTFHAVLTTETNATYLPASLILQN